VERETSVVATGGQSVARAKHGDHIVLLLHDGITYTGLSSWLLQS
jgi:hypothetical protein